MVALAACGGVTVVACSASDGEGGDTPSTTSTSAKLEASDGGAAKPSGKQRVAPDKTKPAGFAGRKDVIHVKFVEGSHVRLRGGALDIPQVASVQLDTEELGRLSRVGLARASARTELARVRSVLAASPRARLDRAITQPEAELDAMKQSAESRSGDEQADLNLWYEINVPEADSPALLAALNASPLVETAYEAPIYEPAAADAAPPTPSYVANQGYLDPGSTTNSPESGIDAKFAWTRTGGTGSTVRVVDVEWAWNTQHEDLGGGGSGGPSVSLRHNGCSDTNHGTAVLGVIRGANNAFGVTGIAHGAQYGHSGVTASAASCSTVNVADALTAAATSPNTAVGDVILLEVHLKGPVNCPIVPAPAPRCFTGTPPASGQPYPCRSQYGFVPVEWVQMNFDVIKTATANGRVVVEAAGNGEMNLDDAVYGGKFDRTVRDSQAIMVGAAIPASRQPECFSNVGSRLDVSAWGSRVRTLGYGNITAATFCPSGQVCDANDQNQWYATGFNGTSSASAIIAGVAASLQGACKAGNVQTVCNVAGMTLPSGSSSPFAFGMRELLTLSGTPQPTPVTLRIGPMANLRGALATLEPPAYGSPVTVKWTATKNAVAAVDNLGMVRMRSKDGAAAWTAPAAISGGGFPAGAPITAAAATSSDTRLYAVGNNGSLYYSRSTSGAAFSTFTAIPGVTAPVGANLATGMRNTNQLHVFWVDSSSRLMTTFSTGTGTTWSAPAVVATAFAPPGAPLATGRQGTTQLDVFAIGTNGALKAAYAVDGGSWQAPVELSPTGHATAWNGTTRSGGGVATGRQGTDQLDAFYIRTTGIMHAAYVVGLGFWNAPVALHTSGSFDTGSQISTVNHGTSDNTLDAFARTGGATPNLSHVRVVGMGAFTGPTAVAMPSSQTINSFVSVTAKRGTTAADVVAIGSNGLEVASSSSGGSWGTFAKLP